jgi:hypothetical protein
MMKTRKRETARWLIAAFMFLSLSVGTQAGEGDYTGYFANLSTQLNQKVSAGARDLSEAALKKLLQDPVFLNTVCQRTLLSKYGVGNFEAFAKADPSNRAFLLWLLQNTKAMDLYLIGAAPTGLRQRDANDYGLPGGSLDIWKRIYYADPESREGLYLRLAIATCLNPPGTGNRGAGQAEKPADPVDRYNHFKSAHKNKELFPRFDNLTVWEYRQIVSSNASDADLKWAREMVNTWRPDLRIHEQVVNSTSEVWYRKSPVPYTDFKAVLEGGGKCGPRSSWAVMICQAFGIPAIGVGQPGHACVAYKAVDPSMEPQPGSVWKVAYGRGWKFSRLEGLSGPDFLAGVEERSRVTVFSQVEHLRWLASALASKEQADAVMGVARRLQQSAPATKVDLTASEKAAEAEAEEELQPEDKPSKAAAPTAASMPEAPFKVAPGTGHFEAELFSGMSGIRVYDCFTGGKQVNFQKNMKSSWIDYKVDVPATGIYGMVMRVATPNSDQIIEVSSGTNKLAKINIPNTTGLWGTTAEVNIRLNRGTQTLRLSAPFQRGIALRWFELKLEGTRQ